jgi:hypothetical protein
MPTERWALRPVDGKSVRVEGTAADIVVMEQKLDPASLNLQIKAGAPSDGDIVYGASDGDIVIDVTNSLIYVRIGGVWKKTGALTT